MYQHQREEHGAHGRHSEDKHLSRQESRDKKEIWYPEVTGVPWFTLVALSLLVTALSLANPLLTNLATDLQSQHLYASWALHHGQNAYANFFGTGGILFYGLLWLSGLLPMGILWAGMQFLLLVFAGVQSYQLVYRLTGHSSLASFMSRMIYCFILTLGFGGLYATIFALPFLLYALNRLVAYLAGQQEIGFIRYGMIGAFAFMISPSATVIFYSVAFLGLLVANLRRRQLAQGIYQFLASLVGFSLLFYPLGYIAVWNGSFGNAVGQIVFDLTNVQLWHSYLLQNALIYLVLAFGLGFLTALLSTLTSLAKGNAELKIMGILGLLVVLLLAIFTPDFGVYNLLAGLPFILLLMTFWMNQRMGVGFADDSRRARHAVPPMSKYLMATFYLPFVVGAYLLVSPAVENYILHGGEGAERGQIATYIRENSDQADKIYAWDDTASLYRASQRLSSSPILSPGLYLTNRENQISLMNGLQQNPRYIVVNNRLSVQADVEKLLADNYQESDQKYSHFKLYQLK